MATPDSPIRPVARFVFHQTHKRLARGFSEVELRQDAMVFAPHPDDETLGCGGTIILKREVGAAVDVVFMTDGAGSHPELISREELARQRHAEAMAATSRLGVDAQHVTWVGFPDGGLANNHEQAVARVTDLLRQKRPAQVFVPYGKHEHPDHIETHAVVREALVALGSPTLVCQYPIWYLNQWPFVRGSTAHRRAWFAGGPRTWAMGILAFFDVRVDMAAAVDGKRRALAEHKSQITRRNGDPRWHTLADIAEGDFLDNFFETEVFACSQIPTGG
jgi:LmbE family N-acetylglucosaminyl deacetylase